MVTLQEAKNYEKRDEVINAADAYEEILLSKQPPLEAFINLAVLYWEFTRYGTSEEYGLDESFTERAVKRCLEVIDQADKHYPNNPDVTFWYLYIRYIDFTDEHFRSKCKELVKDPACSLDPYFYLFSGPDGDNYCKEVLALIGKCKWEKTFKNQYILSVIESLLTQKEDQRRIKSGE